MSAIVYKPQQGLQAQVASCMADVVGMGGAAGSGKTFSLFYKLLLYRDDKFFRGTILRQTKEMVRKQGGLWDASCKIFPDFQARGHKQPLEWNFPSGAQIKFDGINDEADLNNYQGAEIGIIGFDELTHFMKRIFIFMLSRNRTTITPGEGHLRKPQVLFTCNPDPDSWVKRMLQWWIDPITGYPIPERSGVIRYFLMIDDEFKWGNSKRELIDSHPDYFDEEFRQSGVKAGSLIKSFTFIPGSIYENKILLSTQPQYLGSLKSQTEADRKRFLEGNWNVKTDDTCIYDHMAVERLFTTELEDMPRKWSRDMKITCDAAKFGRDFMVIMVWYRYCVIAISVFSKCDSREIHQEITYYRERYGVFHDEVCVDQDGVGGDVVKMGNYYGFVARRVCAKDPTMRVKENYVMRKDQCQYHASTWVNNGECSILFLASCIRIWDAGSSRVREGTDVMLGHEPTDIRILIKQDLHSIKRGKTEFQMGQNMYVGGDLKLCVISKDEQKEILGRSPDFGDNFALRADLDIRPRRVGNTTTYA